MKKVFNTAIALTLFGGIGIAEANKDWQCFYMVLFVTGICIMAALFTNDIERLKDKSKKSH